MKISVSFLSFKSIDFVRTLVYCQFPKRTPEKTVIRASKSKSVKHLLHWGRTPTWYYYLKREMSRKGSYRIWGSRLKWFKVVFQSKKLMGTGYGLWHLREFRICRHRKVSVLTQNFINKLNHINEILPI